jgi:hypothetical protein
MQEPARHILKSDKVKLEGQFQLDVTRAEQGRTKGKTAASAAPQICIVEKHPEFAVMELTCSCGTKTYLRCEYTDDKPSVEGSQTQNGAIAGTDQQTNQAPNQEPEQAE